MVYAYMIPYDFGSDLENVACHNETIWWRSSCKASEGVPLVLSLGDAATCKLRRSLAPIEIPSLGVAINVYTTIANVCSASDCRI